MKYLILFLLAISTLLANSSKEILLLHSYNSGLKWTDGITQGVKEVLEKYPEYELSIEYMDSKKIDDKDYFDSLMNLYEKKFSNRKYDVIISADNYAYEFVLKNYKKLFNGSSIVFCGVENFNKNSIPKELERYVTGVIEYKEIKENLDLIKKTINDLDTIYIVSDDTFSSNAIKEQILNDIKNFDKSINVIFDNQIDISTLSQKVNSLPQNSAVLFTSLYVDKNGKFITYSQLRDFFNSSKYPIFAINKIHLHEGIVGGIMVNPLDQGMEATKKAIAIFEGKKPNEIEISTPSSKYYFDYKILEKYHINSSKIPLLSTIVNEPKSFFEENRKFIDSAFIMMPLLILLIIGLIVNSLPQNSAVLFTSLYVDKNGKFITYSQLRDFFNSSKYPVFAINKIHLHEGIVGGIMVNPLDQGAYAVKKTIEIIEGEKANKIEISTPSSKYYFDYKILEKYHINSSKIPLLSTIVNEPKSFFEENRKFIDSAFIMMPLLILLIIGLIVNILKRVSLEIKLIEQNKLDSVLLNNIKGAIYWKSKEDKLLGCNESFCKLVDLPKDKIIGKDINEIIPELCKKVKSYSYFINEFETTLKFKNEKLNVLIRRKQYFNKRDEEAGVVTVINDITDFKKLQEQNKKDEQFIIQRSKLSEIGEMMTSIAHQWKTPLIEISTIAQELLYKRSKKEFTKEDSQEFVDEIMTQVQYMTRTIDDFRDFIKPSLQKSEFEVNSAIVELLKVIEHNMKYNYIKIDVIYENDEKFKIYGYPNEFKQAILSIINNAKDSILKRRLDEKVDGLITIFVSNKENNICIDIKDNGVGIDDIHLEKVFEPFFTSKENGDGFGLYMVKLIIEDKMNGKIEAIKATTGANILVTLKKEENRK